VPLLLEAKVREQTVSLRSHIPTFAAIDFETADYSRDSACAIAVVRAEKCSMPTKSTHYPYQSFGQHLVRTAEEPHFGEC